MKTIAITPPVEVREMFGVEVDTATRELVAMLHKLPSSAVAAHLYEAGYRPVSNAYREATKPSSEGSRRTCKMMRGKGFSPGEIYEHACRCDPGASHLTVSFGVYKALKELTARFGTEPRNYQEATKS